VDKAGFSIQVSCHPFHVLPEPDTGNMANSEIAMPSPGMPALIQHEIPNSGKSPMDLWSAIGACCGGMPAGTDAEK
jgi:hypothetical protein